METIKIDERTWRIEDGDVRFFLAEGSTRALLVDSGCTSDRALLIALGLTSLPVVLVNTHADPDHIAGNRRFQNVYMHPDEEANYRAHGGQNEIIPVRDGETIHLGDRVMIVTELPGHTPGSIGLVDIGGRILFAGDAIQDADIWMFEERRDLKKFAESLRNLDMSGFDVIYPSHGTFPLEASFVGKLADAAEKVLAGEIKGEAVNVHGNDIKRYETEAAAFLLAE